MMTQPTQTPFRGRLEDRLAKPMFFLALFYLVLLAAFIHRIRLSPAATAAANETEETSSAASLDAWLASLADASPEIPAIFWALLILWPVFVVEGMVRYYLRPREARTAANLWHSLVPALFPPLRMAVRGSTRPGEMWLPWAGWREIRFDLQKDLERFFSPPMLALAMLILPILAIEYFWAEQVAARPALRLALDVGIGIIWLAFATEFIIRISAADSKLSYAFSHWLDLAIVLLPMVEFMPALRLLRVARVIRIDTIMAFVKYYRLYGLAGKGWRAFVILEVIQRLFSRKPEAKLARLRSRLDSKMAEASDLQREIDYYRRQVEQAERKYADEHEGRPPPATEAPTAPPRESSQEPTSGSPNWQP